MTVAVFDPVLPDLLPKLNEPLSFDVSTNVADLVISIVFSDGAWDVVYQDGAFAAGYSSSTRNGSDFEIRRIGGWPEGQTFKVKVKESVIVITPPPPVVSGPGQSWNLIYSVDLSLLPPVSYVGTGPAVIDGLTWWLQNGPGPLTGQSSFIQSGKGLVVRSTTNHLDTAGIAHPLQGHLRWFLPLANLVNYTPGAPVMVLGDFMATVSNNVDFAALGICEGDASAIALGSDSVSHFSVRRCSNQFATDVYYMSIGTSASPNLVLNNIATNPATDKLSRVDGVMLTNSLVGHIVSFANAGATPDPFNDRQVTGIGTVRRPTLTNNARLGIGFTFQTGSNDVKDAYLSKLWVYQPKAP